MGGSNAGFEHWVHRALHGSDVRHGHITISGWSGQVLEMIRHADGVIRFHYTEDSTNRNRMLMQESKMTDPSRALGNVIFYLLAYIFIIKLWFLSYLLCITIWKKTIVGPKEGIYRNICGFILITMWAFGMSIGVTVLLVKEF